MPKPVLVLKREQEKTEETQDKNVLVLPMSEPSAPAPAQPTMPPQPRVAQPMDVQAKFEALLEWISSLSEDQIRTFFTAEGIKNILEHFASKGDPIAKLARAHCYK